MPNRRVSATIRSHVITSASQSRSICRRLQYVCGVLFIARIARRRARGCPCPSFANRGRYAITAPGEEGVDSPVVVMRAMQGKFGPLSFSLAPRPVFSLVYGRYATFPIFRVWRPSRRGMFCSIYWFNSEAACHSLMKRFAFTRDTDRRELFLILTLLSNDLLQKMLLAERRWF
jgi:hypothetical protein